MDAQHHAENRGDSGLIGLERGDVKRLRCMKIRHLHFACPLPRFRLATSVVLLHQSLIIFV